MQQRSSLSASPSYEAHHAAGLYALGRFFAGAVLPEPQLCADDMKTVAQAGGGLTSQPYSIQRLWRAEFARAAIGNQEPWVLRIGLHGARDIGKSTFVAGMLDHVTQKAAIEQMDFGKIKQTVWYSSAGWIRHYDARCPVQLPSYRDNDLSQYGFPRTDIVEHPEWDIHDPSFNYTVAIKAPRCDGPHRSVKIFADDAMIGNSPYREFISACPAWNADVVTQAKAAWLSTGLSGP